MSTSPASRKNLGKAKDNTACLITAEKRHAGKVRAAEEFKPYDEVIMKQIPGNDAVEAEAKRQEIRDKYAAIQSNIDAVQCPEEIKSALGLD